MITGRIPSSGENIPVVGMGSWKTFDVDASPSARARLRAVLEIFFEKGGRLIDSSPTFGRSERVLGELLSEINAQSSVFSVTKVWTPGRRSGISLWEESQRLWRIQHFDLILIHTLVDWQERLHTLQTWKAEGRVRYIGIMRYLALGSMEWRRYGAMEGIMVREPIDFVEFTYNLADRTAEKRLLPLALDRGIAVLANSPFAGGDLFKQVKGKPLPSWAAEFDCSTWAQLFLKFVVSHPAVTCTIAATSNPQHVADNMAAMTGRVLDAPARAGLAEYVLRRAM